ncbi:MAG: peptidylprolyl isomerase [Spirochaetes bacterium]|nr:peptidylprolyl isomerase [Spirochaetota bacterium]
MKKATLLICIMSVILLGIFCKRDSDVLATYNSGKITRGEFHEWLDAHHINRESILKKKKQQINKLQTMALWRLAAAEAKKIGFDQSEEFKAMADISTESQLISVVLKKEVGDKPDFNEPAVKLRQIVLNVKNFTMVNNKRVDLKGAELEKEFDKAIKEAKEIIAQLDAGESFEELAKKHSQDFSKSKGGEVGYVVRSMLEPPLAKVAFELPVGQYSKEPIRLSNSVAIIKVEEKTTLTSRNIEDIVGNKIQAARLKNKLAREANENYILSLKNAPDVIVSLENTTKKDKNAVLFKVGNEVCTVGDLEKRIDVITNKIFKDSKERNKITDEQKKRLAESMLRYTLLKRVAEQKGINRDPDYIKKVSIRLEGLLAREYMKYIGTKDIKISEQEIREEYEKNKDKRYYTMKKIGGRNQKMILPYSEARERIEKTLLVKRQAEVTTAWKDKLLRDENFMVNENELTGE